MALARRRDQGRGPKCEGNGVLLRFWQAAQCSTGADIRTYSSDSVKTGLEGRKVLAPKHAAGGAGGLPVVKRQFRPLAARQD